MSTTLWTLCRSLTADELTALHEAALGADRNKLKRLIGARFSCTNSELMRLANELLRLVQPASIDDMGPSDNGLSQSAIVGQLNAIVGLGGLEAQPIPWQLEVASSSVPNSGCGVFLHGTCSALSVLCIYPGTAYTMADLPHAAKRILEGNHYVLFLRNGVVLDGRPDGPSRAAFKAALERDLDAGGSPLVEDGTLAVGHRVNHAPRGVRPNTFVLPLTLARDEHVALHPHLPVVSAQPPTADGWKRTAVLVSSRPLCDEELWLDYKLCEAAHALPSWYAQASSPEVRHVSERRCRASRGAGLAGDRRALGELPIRPCYHY